MKFTTTLLALTISKCALAVPIHPYSSINLNYRQENSTINSTTTTNSNGEGSTLTSTTNRGSIAGELEFGGSAAAADDGASTSAAVSSECGTFSFLSFRLTYSFWTQHGERARKEKQKKYRKRWREAGRKTLTHSWAELTVHIYTGPVGCTSAASSAGPQDGSSSGSTSSSVISGKVTWEEHYWEHTTFSDVLQDKPVSLEESKDPTRPRRRVRNEEIGCPIKRSSHGLPSSETESYGFGSGIGIALLSLRDRRINLEICFPSKLIL